MWPFGWLKKQREKHETVERVYEKRGVDINQPGPIHRAIQVRRTAEAQVRITEPQPSTSEAV
jgi:hypothetical protein